MFITSYKGESNLKKHLISLMVLFLLVSSSLVAISSPIASTSLGNHAPIQIIGNNQFTVENGVTDGSGTEEDPYIIENWVIVSDGSSSEGIFINDTDAYFIIKNCTIQGFNHPDEHYHGIQLSVVTNGRIENTIMTECQTGIDIRHSTKNELINCSCSDYPHQNAYSIRIIQSTNITIISCICNGMSIGVYISESSDIILQKTECSNNTVWGLVADVLYQNVLNYLIEDCTFNDNAFYGIYLSGSLSTSCSIIRNCSISNNDNGIKLERLSDNIIENCVFNQNTIGLYLDRSNRNTIRNCSFRSHVDEGVFIAGMLFLQISIPRDNEISYCDFIDNYDGILLLETQRNTIHHCTFAHNTYTGITSLYSVSKITSNNFIDNGNDSYYIDTAGMYSWSSFLDGRNNWWGSSQGPCVSLLFRQTILPLRTVENSDIVMLRRGFALFRPWLSESVPDAGRQT